jgi:hypothetical protein
MCHATFFVVLHSRGSLGPVPTASLRLPRNCNQSSARSGLHRSTPTLVIAQRNLRLKSFSIEVIVIEVAVVEVVVIRVTVLRAPFPAW